MILIITIDWDNITFNVCEWLSHYGIDFRLISPMDNLIVERVSEDGVTIRNATRNYKLDLAEVNGVFYRQGEMVFYSNDLKDIDSPLAQLKLKEALQLKEYFGYELNLLPHLGNHDKPDLNKLLVLKESKAAGLNVPKYLYTGNKSEVEVFKKENPELITKVILPGFRYEKNGEVYLPYTEIFSDSDFEGLPDQFQTTFFQVLVRKKFDIRAFYLNKEIFSVAILSQQNKKTEIDFRKYDRVLPNRVVPFILPQSVVEKLKVLISNLSLSYCSIDLIYGQDKQFHFLEINPIGQFGVVSLRGNYYLEKKIANWFKDIVKEDAIKTN